MPKWDVASRPGGRVEIAAILDVIERRAVQVRAAGDEGRHCFCNRLEHVAAGLAGRDFRVGGEFGDLLEQVGGDFQLQRRVEFLRERGIRFLPLGIERAPFVILRRELRGVCLEIGVRLRRDVEMFRGQAEVFTGFIDEFRAAFTVRLGGAGDFGDAFADECPCNDELRLAGGGLRLLKRGEERLHVVAGDRLHAPLGRLEALAGVLALRDLRHGVERDVVGIVNEDQVIELEMPGELDRFHSHAFLHAAIARERDDVVVKNLVRIGIERRRRHFLRDGVADRVRHALPERSRGGFHAQRFMKFRMPRRARVFHAEIRDLLDGHLRGTRPGAATNKGTSTRALR